jgi:hypothetical protein
MNDGFEDSSPLSRGEERYAETLLAECDGQLLSGLVSLMRFGIASSGNAHGGYATAAWLLNSARHQGLPRIPQYSRQDGTGFAHCDAEWLEMRSASLPKKHPAETAGSRMRREFLAAILAAGAKVHNEALGSMSASAIEETLANQLEDARPTVLIISTAVSTVFGIVLALNRSRSQMFYCEVEETRARLKWIGIEVLKNRAIKAGAMLDLVSLATDEESSAAQTELVFRGQKVVYLDSVQGRELLRRSEGLSIVAYAALHGNNQRDLSSCQVASLSSLVLPKGARGRVTLRAGMLVDAQREDQPADTQAVLRSLAAQQLRDRKGVDFRFRGLSIDELRHLADSVGLKVKATELFEGAGEFPQEVSRFRRAARGALGRTIVNFARSDLDQHVGGHHAVVVAYHPGEDVFLVDDPAGFKMPPYWVDTTRLVKAMATFDDAKAVERFRGYLVVDGERRSGPSDDEVSMSVVIRKPR